MTRAEMINVFEMLQITYPGYAPWQNTAKLPDIITLWTEMFKAVPFETMKQAITKIMVHNKFAPAISEVAEKIHEITTPEVLGSAEAYEEVRKAVQRFGFARMSEATLSPLARKTLECFGVRSFCMSEEPEIARAQFMRMYDQIAARTQCRGIDAKILPDMLQKTESLRIAPSADLVHMPTEEESEQHLKTNQQNIKNIMAFLQKG